MAFRLSPWGCRFLLLLVVAAVPAGARAEPSEPSPTPNIVIFLADDLGYADLGVQGCQDIPTPHIDSIAKGGVRFTDGYANHPVCSPSRAALMSGRYPHRFGFEHNSGPERYAAENFGLPRDEPTLAERLKPLGYATGMVGKWHIGFKEGLRPHERGFDFHFGFLSGAHTYLPGKRDPDPLVRNGTTVTDEKEYLTDAFAREAVSFLDRSKGGPFLLYMALNAVHAPLEATSKYEQRFASITDPKRRTYAGMLSAMDDAVGRVLAKLKEIGQDENTLIFFYSDNGGPTSQTTSRNDPLRGFKGQVLEGGIRVPFLVRWQGRLPEGKVYDQPVMAFDIHATALAAAGGTFPTEKPLDGVDLLPFLTGEKSGAPHDRLFWRSGPQSAVRMGDWKLVSVRGEAPQLFNLRDDVGESQDRAQAEPAKLAELRTAYQAWDAQMMPAQWVRQDARTARRSAAGPVAPAGADPFRERDRDGDGKLTREELGFPRLFDRLDTDKDGFLTRKEAEPAIERSGERARSRPEPGTETTRPPGEPAPRAAVEPSARQSPRNNGQRPAAGGAGGALRSAIEQRYRQLDTDRDGRLSAEEGKPLGPLFDRADADRDGFLTPSEATRYFQNPANRLREGILPPVDLDSVPAAPIPPPERPGEPSLKPLPDSDAVRDAAGRGQLFESIHVPGITDVREGMNGFALADLNRDGRPDLIATYSPPRVARESRLAVLINDGGFRFTPHQITIRDSELTMEDFGGSAQIPNLADFNGDGWLDIVVTRSAPMLGGRIRGDLEPLGVTFLLSDGRWDRFVDVSKQMGARNELGYNRQTSFGDVNGDGWLDIAIGCDNIKNGLGGLPHSRLYVYKPGGANFTDGKFEDIGGTDLVPDFGGFYHDSARDKAGPGISLRDLDNDGDLDLLQSYHVDVRQPLLPYWPGEYRQGVMCWKNLLRETGTLRFEKVTGNGLHCEASLKYNRDKQLYEPASDARAPGLPYVSLADVNCDGLQDVLAIGPDSDYWAPRVEHVNGRFWRNLGGFRFQECTDAVGLGPLNNTYGQWMAFFDEPEPARWKNWRPRGTYESQPGLTPKHPSKNTPYFSDAVFGDFNNDGALDVVVMNRSESTMTRSMLFMGKGDGTFEVKPTTFSGLDSSGISGEAADLDGDGLLDLVFAADPDNSLGPGQTVAPERYESKVYWNTGAHGAKDNHWLRLRFSGVKDAELIGARVEAFEPGTGKRLGTRVVAANHSYKSGGALEAHFGLGQAQSADITVTLLDGDKQTFLGVGSNQMHSLSLVKP